MKEIIEKVESIGSKIYLVDGSVKIVPSIGNKDLKLYEKIKNNKSEIITYLTKRWINEKDTEEIKGLYIQSIKDLPLPPIVEIEIPGFDKVFFDFTKNPKIGNEYGVVFTNKDIDVLLQYYYKGRLIPGKMIELCKKKKNNREMYYDDRECIGNYITFGLFLNSITAKIVSIRLEE